MTASAPTFRLVVKTAGREPVGWTVLLFDVLPQDRARGAVDQPGEVRL
jgi:hypothetical protein